MHALIVGPRGVGKSTLICRVLRALDRPVRGFETKKEDALALPELGSPVSIYAAGEARQHSEDNLICYTGNKNRDAMTSAFDRFAPRLREPFPEGCVVLMDELGFMESASEAFCGAVMHLLDGSIPAIAAVKVKDIPFLNTVSAHPNCRCFYINKENRDELFEEVLRFMEEQFAER